MISHDDCTVRILDIYDRKLWTKNEFAQQRKQSKRRMRHRSEVVHSKSIMKMKMLPTLFTTKVNLSLPTSRGNKLLWCKTFSNWNLLIQQVPYIQDDRNSFQALGVMWDLQPSEFELRVLRPRNPRFAIRPNTLFVKAIVEKVERKRSVHKTRRGCFTGADLVCVLSMLICICLSFSILIP